MLGCVCVCVCINFAHINKFLHCTSNAYLELFPIKGIVQRDLTGVENRDTIMRQA